MNIILIISLLVIVGVLIWALAGGRGEEKQKPDARKDDETVIEKTFRRRASDKEIEERFPGETAQGPRRRKSDMDAPAPEPGPETGPSFRLPYLADEIIPETSQFRIYRRTLLNSEIYAAKGDFTTAISLYDGVKSRIKDAEVRGRIDSDIDYLKKFRQRKEYEAKRREESAYRELEPQKPRNIDTSQLRITLDGTMPNSINIDSVPDTINIGVIDPTKDLSPDTIARKVSQELREDMADLRAQIREVRQTVPVAAAAPAADEAVPGPAAAEIAALGDEMDSLRRRMDRISSTPTLTGSEVQEIKEIMRDAAAVTPRPEIAQYAPSTDESLPAAETLARAATSLESVKPALDGMADVAREVRDLSRSVKEMVDRQIEDSEKTPAVTEARFEAPRPGTVPVEARALSDLLSRIPRETAPAPRPLSPPDAALAAEPAMAPGETAPWASETLTPPATEQIVEKTLEKTAERAPGEPETDFELLSEYGADNYGDGPSDEEIFAKILKGDREPVKDNFEIIGEKKDDVQEYNVADEEFETRRREEESFYRTILQSDRRKKRELPILKVTYDFTKLPDELSLSREKNIIEYAFYKYKPMLEKANEFIKKRKVRDAINYYKVVMGQNIPPEFKVLIRRNLNDLNEYLEKYLTAE